MITLGVAALALALVALWAVTLLGLFTVPPRIALVPVAAAALVAIATARTAVRMPDRRRRTIAFILATLSLLGSGLATAVWNWRTLHPPAPIRMNLTPLQNLNRC